MYTVKGTMKGGVVVPERPISDRDGQKVLITFLEDDEFAMPDDAGEYPSLEEVVARIKAQGPNLANIVRATESLAEALANAPNETPIDSAKWNRQWAEIEEEMKRRDLANDEAEGLL